MKNPPVIYLIMLAFMWGHGVFGQDPMVIKYRPDSIRIDSLPEERSVKPIPIYVVSPDSIDSKVEYGSLDSNYLDNQTRKVYLFGGAYVRYKDLSLKADYIVVDLDSSIAVAEGLLDSLGELQGNPEFNMADESFKAKRIRYNFRTRKGFIYDVVAEEGDLLIHGSKTKFVAAAGPGRENDILYNEGALITTCDHPEPHYGIRARKVKTIPDKLAVVGASHLELFGVPTPLWLPFGFYPVSEKRTAGVIFPRDYERSPEFGFGLREFGYYFPVKEWAEVRLTGDIYFNGTWGAAFSSNYLRKYKYRGNLRLGYSNRITEANESYLRNSQKSFSINISHNQDSKAHPYQTIGGSINIQTNDYQSLNYNDAASVLTTNYSSNFNYSRIFPNKPYSLTAGFNHSQNTRTHQVTINAPELNFRLNRIYPFKSKKRLGPDQWYEKIAFQYSGNAKTQIVGTDTTLFEKETWDNAQAGFQHRASMSTNFSVLKYFNFTPSVDYGETWFAKVRDPQFTFDPNDTMFVKMDTIFFPDGGINSIVLDTINTGIVKPDLTKFGLSPFRTISGSINMNTQIFGLIQFGNGWLRGIRHVIKPNIGFSYAPKSPNNYYQFSEFSVAFPDSMKRFSRFENLLFGVRPIDDDQALINYSFTNLFEAKYFSRRDSTEKKLKLFDNISVSGYYNVAVDTFNFSPLNISGNTRFFKGITTLSVGAHYSFYGLKDNGRLDTFLYLKTHNKLLRFDNLRLRFSSLITFREIIDLFNKKPEASDRPSAGIKPPSGRVEVTKDKFFDLLSDFSINHEMLVMRFGMTGKDTMFIATNSINMTGSMRVTPNWSLRFGNIGYDFNSKQLTYPDIGIARDLHCWEISFNFQPTRATYSFHIGVKPGSFDFLKFPYRRGNESNFGFR